MKFEHLHFTEFGHVSALIDGVLMNIPDDMSNRHRRQIWDEWEMAPALEGTPDGERVRINTIAPYIAPVLEPQPYWLYKSVFIRRMREEPVDEAAVLNTVLQNVPAKLRMLYDAVEYFMSDDDLFDDLHAAIAAALGEERADELLAEDVPA